MKKVGELRITGHSAGDVEKDVWGDMYPDSQEDSDVDYWGIIKLRLSRGAYKMHESEIDAFREDFQNVTGLNLKVKHDEDKYGGRYVRIYIARPIGMMNDIVTALKEYTPPEDCDVQLEIDVDDFDYVRKAEIAKAI